MNNFEFIRPIEAAKLKLDAVWEIIRAEEEVILSMTNQKDIKEANNTLNAIADCCNICERLIAAMYNELKKRGDYAENLELKTNLQKAGAYIRSLGGDPTIISYVKTSDK